MYEKFLLEAMTLICAVGSFSLIHFSRIAETKKSPILSVLKIKYLFNLLFKEF